MNPTVEKKLRDMDDDQLMETVTKPKDGQMVKVKPDDPRVWDGNTRINEMKRRIDDPNSRYTKETEIPVEVFDN